MYSPDTIFNVINTPKPDAAFLNIKLNKYANGMDAQPYKNNIRKMAAGPPGDVN